MSFLFDPLPSASTGTVGFTLTADQGSFALTGQAAALLRDLIAIAAAGSFTLTGQDATLTHDIPATLVAAAGSFTVSGQDIGFVVVHQYTFDAAAGAYVLTGRSINLIGPGDTGGTNRGTTGINFKIGISI